MCNIWKNPTNRKEELKAEDLKCLPDLKFINLTGGEPFIREDLADIVEECYKHTNRIVISTSGWFEDRVVALAKKYFRNPDANRAKSYQSNFYRIHNVLLYTALSSFESVFTRVGSTAY